MLDAEGIKLTEISEIVDVILRMACDDDIRGRSVAVHAGTAYDTCDGTEVCAMEAGSVYDGMLTSIRSTNRQPNMRKRIEGRRRKFGTS
jgi:hypothetical protein